MPRRIWIKVGSNAFFWLRDVNIVATEDKRKLNFRLSRENMISLY